MSNRYSALGRLTRLVRVNVAQSAAELEALRSSVNRGTPYGSDDWRMRMAKRLRLEFTLQSRGRPKKEVG